MSDIPHCLLAVRFTVSLPYITVRIITCSHFCFGLPLYRRIISPIFSVISIVSAFFNTPIPRDDVNSYQWCLGLAHMPPSRPSSPSRFPCLLLDYTYFIVFIRCLLFSISFWQFKFLFEISNNKSQISRAHYRDIDLKKKNRA